MATTTNYSWTTPDDTALVKDGAAAIRTLGSSIDTTTKALNPSTTLGDIEYRSSTANTNTRLPIGSTGNILTVSGGVPTWAAPASAGALTLISSTTFTTSSAHNVSNVFSSTYRNYMILLAVDSSSATDYQLMRLRTGSGDDTTSNYYSSGYYNFSGSTAVSGEGSSATTSFGIGYAESGQGDASWALNIFSPNLADKTSYTGQHTRYIGTGSICYQTAGVHTSATQFTGFTILPASGTITGEVRVYGYSN